MNWDAIGAVGEILGAVAVIATLIYLAKQIRQQNTIAKFESAKAIYQDFADISHSISSNGDLASISRRGDADPTDLDDDEARRYQYVFRSYYMAMVNAWRAHELGFLDDEEWSELATEFANNLQTPGGAAFRKHSMNHILPGFVDAIESARKRDSKREDYSLGRQR